MFLAIDSISKTLPSCTLWTMQRALEIWEQINGVAWVLGGKAWWWQLDTASRRVSKKHDFNDGSEASSIYLVFQSKYQSKFLESDMLKSGVKLLQINKLNHIYRSLWINSLEIESVLSWVWAVGQCKAEYSVIRLLLSLLKHQWKKKKK